jgi:hypothetical protein
LGLEIIIMMRRNILIQNFLILIILLHLGVCPALHEYQDFKETEIFSPNAIFENAHHHHLAVNEEKNSPDLVFSNTPSSLVIFPPAANLFQPAPCHSFLPLISDQQAAVLRC